MPFREKRHFSMHFLSVIILIICSATWGNNSSAQTKANTTGKDSSKAARNRVQLQNDTANVRNHLLWKNDQPIRKNNPSKRVETDLNKDGHPMIRQSVSLSDPMNHVSSGRKIPDGVVKKRTQTPNSPSSSINKGEMKQQKEPHPQNHILWKKDTTRTNL